MQFGGDGLTGLDALAVDDRSRGDDSKEAPMNRRKLFAWLGGGIAFATAGGLAIAKAAPALSAQHKLAENF